MIIADLFVNLGIKGAEKTVGALTGIEKSMKGLGSMSLEAKAAIIGAMYALERLFAQSGQAGTDLTNFNALLGTSTKTLQQYQFAARQAGISNQETENSFKTLQSTMTKLRMGEGAPKGYAQVAMLTGGITSADVDRFMQNPELLLQKLQLYAQKEKRLGIRNEALKSFGLSDNMVAALSRNAFSQNTLQKAPTYSEKEISALDKANIAWSNLGNKIAMAIGHFNAMHGGQLVKDLSILTDKILILTNAFIKLAEAIHLFEGISKAVEGLTMIFSGITNTTTKLGSEKGRKSLKGDAEEFVQDIPGMISVLKEGFENLFFGNGEEKEQKKPEKSPAGVKPSQNTKALPEKPVETKRPNTGAMINNFFKKEAGVFNPLAEDIFGKNPGKTVPENAVTSIKEIQNNSHESQTTLIKPGKENPGAEEKPTLRLVVPQAPLAPAAPNVSRATGAKTTTQNFNVNQSFSYSGDGKDARNTADTMKKAVNEAFRQMSSQVQGS